MTPSRWSDLERPPLNASALRRGLVRPDALWTSFDVVDCHRLHQHRSRRPRRRTMPPRARCWSPRSRPRAADASTGAGRPPPAPASSSPYCCGPVRRRPTATPRAVHRWGWLPLLAGVATATALSRTAGVDTALKWPNDLLVTVDGEERKAGGILAERQGADAVVIGLGVNVSLRADELPVPTATSLALAGRAGHRPRPAAARRTALARRLVRRLARGRRRPDRLPPPADVRGRLRHARPGGARRTPRRPGDRRTGGQRRRRRPARHRHS